ncbi:inositol monophosphatase family protein [Pseudarthrobacter sp. J1738]|uniref:inositol monophosphatase family protein n=1 Tax=Pseudarthrobacter sp. J1738 TaxID=3420446 RepID=UPI003D27A7C0
MSTGRHSAAQLDPSLDDYQLASALVREAGQLALLMRMGGLSGEQKTSVSDVVTAADRAAEAYVLEQLRRCRPEDSILGEEGASFAGTSGRTWVIDPVDGTYNFLQGSSYWCSAIALKGGGAAASTVSASADPEVILGAIYQPEMEKLWLGGVDHAATLNDETLVGPSSADLDQLGAATYIHPRWLVDPMAAMPWHAAAVSAATLRMFGSGSCDLARVADGEIGVWFQHSCPEWDWLPGKAIVRAAGGRTAVVAVNGLNWFVAGGANSVKQVVAALQSGSVQHLG